MEINKTEITLARIGDQLLFKQKEGGAEKWLTEGYYQLGEISSIFGDRLISFTAFGRIAELKSDIKGLYEIPVNSVRKFNVSGVKIIKKGIWPYLQTLPLLIWKVRKVTATHNISWFMVPSLAGLVGSLVAPKCTLRVVHLVGEYTMPLRLKYPKLAPFIVPLTEWLIRLALRRADMAVFVSNYLKQKYGQKLKCRAVIANESRLRPWMIRKTNRRIIHKPLRVLYVGRLVPEKGIQFLLEAIALVSNKIPCEFWIMGSGPFEEELKVKAKELRIEKFIQWKGWVSWGEKLFEIMREADVLVMPSLTEGVGMVHFEAMGQSLPVIASQIGGIPEIVKHGISGLLVEPGDSSAIAQAVYQIITNVKLRQRLVTKGLRIAKENTVETQTGRVIDIMCALIKTK